MLSDPLLLKELAAPKSTVLAEPSKSVSLLTAGDGDAASTAAALDRTALGDISPSAGLASEPYDVETAVTLIVHTAAVINNLDIDIIIYPSLIKR
jgi:hypothetical protein